MGSKDAKDSRTNNFEPPATREQLLDYYGAHGYNDFVPRQDPMFALYYNEQNNQGIPDPRNNNQKGWPVNCRRVSMISGTINGVYQSEGYPGALALHSETYFSPIVGYGLVGLLFFLNPQNSFSWLLGPVFTQLAKGDIWIAPALNQSSYVTKAKYLWKNRDWSSTNTYPNVLGSIDLLPGGKRAFFQEIKDKNKDKWYTKTDFNVYVKYSNFIPTASSLALGKGRTPNPNRKWDDNLYNINLVCAGETPFDAYYGPINTNLRHDSLFEQQALYVLDEINGIPMTSAVDYSSIHPIQIFSGIEPVCTATTYQVDNLPSGATVTWQTSPSGIVSLSQSGNLVTVTRITDGTFSLTARINKSGCTGTSTRSPIQAGGTGWQEQIYGSTYVSCGETVSYQVANTLGFAYNWSFPSDWIYGQGQGSPVLYVQIPYTGGSPGNVEVTIFDGCSYWYSSLYVDTYSGNYFYSMSPNPASSTLTVSAKETVLTGQKSNKTITELNIYDQFGNLKKHQNFGKVKSATLNVSELIKGIYFIEIVDGQYKERQKIIIQR